ncbi:1717_t:CDS:1, partial [Rhizophagus irregularis]
AKSSIVTKISDTVTSGNTSGISSEKPVCAKNGQGLIQEISRNFDESGTPSSIRDYDFTCALPNLTVPCCVTIQRQIRGTIS